MTPYFQDGGVTLLQGDVLATLRALPTESIQCCVTSPPYWGLRSYGTNPQIWGGDPACGHEWGAMERGKRKDIKPADQTDCVCRLGTDERQNETLNGGNFCQSCGAWRGEFGLEPTPDLYVQHSVEIFREVRRVLKDDGTLWLNLGDSYSAHPGQRKETDAAGEKQQTKRGSTATPSRCVDGIKAKDLIGIPWMTAFALRADGWYLRQEIIWHKPAPMPESVGDRPTRAHEQIFLMAKSQTYYYDADAIREPFATDPKENYPARAAITGRGDQGFAEARGNDRGKTGGFPPASHKGSSFHRGKTAEHQLNRASEAPREDSPLGRNKRSVWTVNTKPYPEAHFATFPPDLIRPCILAGAPVGGVVLDPFSGSGTTLFVARQMGRAALGIELKPEYCDLAVKRLGQAVMEF